MSIGFAVIGIVYIKRLCCAVGESWDMPEGKTIMYWALAALVTMYAIRYLRNSNSIVAGLYPQGMGGNGSSANPSGVQS